MASSLGEGSGRARLRGVDAELYTRADVAAVFDELGSYPIGGDLDGDGDDVAGWPDEWRWPPGLAGGDRLVFAGQSEPGSSSTSSRAVLRLTPTRSARSAWRVGPPS